MPNIWRCFARSRGATALGLLLVAATTAHGGSVAAGDYRIHYNAMRSDNLSQRAAERIGVERAAKRIVLLVNVQRGDDNARMPAEVRGKARNLIGNIRKLDFRAWRHESGVDYLAQTLVANAETLTFDLTITPEGGEAIDVRFRETFYTR